MFINSALGKKSLLEEGNGFDKCLFTSLAEEDSSGSRIKWIPHRNESNGHFGAILIDSSRLIMTRWLTAG